MPFRPFYDKIPHSIKTDYNDRIASVTGDIMFSKDATGKISGIAGDVGNLPSELVERYTVVPRHPKSPFADNLTTVVTGRGKSGEIVNIRTLEEMAWGVHSGDTTANIDRMFRTTYQVWNPPVNLEKITNPQRYVWLSSEPKKHVVEEASGSATIIHEMTSSGEIIRHEVVFEQPATPVIGDLWEDLGDQSRRIYRWDGSAWTDIAYAHVDDLSGISASGFYHVSRVGNEFGRTVIWRYSEKAYRWIPNIVIRGKEPATLLDRMIYESTSTTGERVLYQRDAVNGDIRISWTPGKPSDISNPSDGMYVLDTRSPNDNWWVYREQLSSGDLDAITSDMVASRSIIEFWGGIEKSGRVTDESDPLFMVYSYDTSSGSFVNPRESQIFRFYPGSEHDRVLDRKIRRNPASGQVMFESLLVPDRNGYLYFKDVNTGKFHSVWKLAHGKFLDGSKVLNANPDHGVPSEITIGDIDSHVRAHIEGQEGYSGNILAYNNFSWLDKDPSIGTIVDPDHTPVRAMSLTTLNNMDLEEIMRKIALAYEGEYGRVRRILEEYHAAGKLVGNPATDLDLVLTEAFNDRRGDSPFADGNMGTYFQTEWVSGDVDSLAEPHPILLPQSPAMIGAVQAKLPEISDGYLYDHMGGRHAVHGDYKDEVLLELERRIHSNIPSEYADPDNATARSRFNIWRYIDRSRAFESFITVDRVVQDASTMSGSDVVFDIATGSIGRGDGSRYLLTPSRPDVHIHDGTDLWYFNGHSTFKVNVYQTKVENAIPIYAWWEFLNLLSDSFEQYISRTGLDYVSNINFDENDRFTWNYSSAGVEGHWRGIYRRVYGTDEPHRSPWKAIGYQDKPSWFDNVYPTHAAFWAAVGLPSPVDGSGNLLDPIAAGIVDESNLDKSRIGENWKFGDGSPVEMEFFDSMSGVFALVLAGYRMATSTFTDLCWTHYMKRYDGFADGEHLLHVDTGTRPSLDEFLIHHATDASGNRVIRYGLNSWVANIAELEQTSIDDIVNPVVSKSDTRLAWLAEGFVHDDGTRIYTLGGAEIPKEDIRTVIHHALPHDRKTLSGMIFIKDSNGYRIGGYDMENPVFTVSDPLTDGSALSLRELKERITVSDPDVKVHPIPFPIRKEDPHSVVVNGYLQRQEFYTFENGYLKFQDEVAFVTGDLIEVTKVLAPGSDIAKMFRVELEGENILVPYVEVDTGIYSDHAYWSWFQTPSDVLNFIFGYARKVADDGWIVSRRTWEDIAESFLLWARSNDNDPLHVTPITEDTRLAPEFGTVEVSHGPYGSDVRDIDGYSFRRQDYDIIQKPDGYAINSINGEKIYFLSYSLKLVQHAVLIPDVTQFNDRIRNPVLSNTTSAIRVETYRTMDWNGSLYGGGVVVTGNSIVANLDKHATDITRYLDSVHPVSDSRTRELSKRNYYWTPNAYRIDDNGNRNPYLSVTGASEESMHAFFSGAMQAKGTIRPAIAFSRSEYPETFEHADLWAWRTQRFGEGRTREVSFNFDLSRSAADRLILDLSSDDIEWVNGPLTDFRFTDWPITIRVYEDDALVDVLMEFDPAKGILDSDAMSKIDKVSPFDPVSYSNTTDWRDRDGFLWLDNANSDIFDHTRMDDDELIEKWGKQKTANATFIRDGQIVTATLTDSHTKQPFVHGLAVGNRVKVTSLNGRYMGEVEVTSTPTSTSFTFEVDDLPEDDIGMVEIGFIRVSKWVVSDNPPDSYSAGNPRFGNDTYMVFDEYDRAGNNIRKYGFWVNDQETDSLEKILHDPYAGGHGYIARIDDTRLLMVFTRKPRNARLEMVEHIHDTDVSYEWEVFSELSNFIPGAVIGKIVDSLSGKDSLSNPVPHPYLLGEDRFGNSEFPAQTIYRNRELALENIQREVNRVLRNINLASYSLNVSSLFPASDEGTWWKKADFIEEEFLPLDKKVPDTYETVRDYSVLASRVSDGRYFAGDIVKVLDTDTIDPWNSSSSHEYAVIEEDANGALTWRVIGRGNVTIELDIASTDTNRIRSVFQGLFSMLAPDPRFANRIMFICLREMLYQNRNCDWFIKTSFVDLAITATFNESPFMLPDKPEAVISAFLDTKAFRSKLRRGAFRYRLVKNEDVSTEIADSWYPDLSLSFDRVACIAGTGGSKDPREFMFGFDSSGFDAELLGLDMTLEAMTDCGEGEFVSVGKATIEGPVGEGCGPYVLGYDSWFFDAREFDYVNIQSISTVTGTTIRIMSILNPLLGGYEVRYYRGSERINPSELDIKAVIPDQSGVTIEFGVPVGSDIVAELLVRFVVRERNGTFIEKLCGFGTMVDCSSTEAEERVENDMQDGTTITVTTYDTGAYGGFDGASFDTVGVDGWQALGNPKVFHVIAGGSSEVSGLEYHDTYYDTVLKRDATGLYVEHSGINRAYMILSGGNELEFSPRDQELGGFSKLLDVNFLPDIDIITDSRTSYSVPIEYDMIYLDGVLQVQGTDYNVTITGNEKIIDFVQIPPTIVNDTFASLSRSYIADGLTLAFPTGFPAAGTFASNTFVFVNGLLLDVSDYTIDGTGNVVLPNSLRPSNGDSVDLMTFNHATASGLEFAEHITSITGLNLSLPAGIIGNGEMIFVNGVYQIEGVDYNVVSATDIQFASSKVPSDRITVRYLDTTNAVSIQRQVNTVVADGTSVTVLGTAGMNPNNTFVFVNGILRSDNDYIVSNAPDTLTWTSNQPSFGDNVTVVIVDEAILSSSLVVSTYPGQGRRLKAVATPPAREGDPVRIFFDDIFVGDYFSYNIVNIPFIYSMSGQYIHVCEELVAATFVIDRIHSTSTINAFRVIDGSADTVDHATTDLAGTQPDNGATVLNLQDGNHYTGDGLNWNLSGTMAVGDLMFVKHEQAMYEMTTNGLKRVLTPDGGYSVFPVHFLRPWGYGITYDTFPANVIVG